MLSWEISIILRNFNLSNDNDILEILIWLKIWVIIVIYNIKNHISSYLNNIKMIFLGKYYYKLFWTKIFINLNNVEENCVFYKELNKYREFKKNLLNKMRII